jgi:hypothetical protein
VFLALVPSGLAAPRRPTEASLLFYVAALARLELQGYFERLLIATDQVPLQTGAALTSLDQASVV